MATGQVQDDAAYGALNLPSRPAGWSYQDPVTNTLVYKVTDPSTPGTPNAIPHYSEGGPYISLPWTDAASGHTMYTLQILAANVSRLVDFDYEAGAFSNWRDAPWGQMDGSFSYNPQTPRIAHYTSGSGVIRYDTEAMAPANTGNFPGPSIGSGWFQQDVNDAWFVAYTTSTGQVRAWNAVTDEFQNWGTVNDEPHLVRDGSYVFGVNRSTPIDVEQGDLATGPTWELNLSNIYPNMAASHPSGTTNGYLIGNDANTSGGPTLYYYDPVTRTRTYIGNPLDGSGHHAAQWYHNNPAGTDYWFLVSGYGNSSANLAKKAVGLRRLSGEYRLLAHHYSSADQYYSQPHATISPDGKLVMWGSDMNNAAGRIDTFLAIVPTKAP